MKNLIFIITILIFISCSKKAETKRIHLDESKELVVADTIEHFSDSTNFGKRLHSKIDIYKIDREDGTVAKVYLFSKNKNHWKLKDSLILDAVRINDLKAEVKDFNGDHYKDIIFTTGMAARGGNVIQTLILYSTEDNSLKWIKNSEDFPNLLYNEKLKCIDAFILTGGQTTVFLKIQNDSLKEFATVDQRDGKIATEILDENGNWKEIETIKDEPSGFDRFINFKPIEKRK